MLRDVSKGAKHDILVVRSCITNEQDSCLSFQKPSLILSFPRKQKSRELNFLDAFVCVASRFHMKLGVLANFSCLSFTDFPGRLHSCNTDFKTKIFHHQQHIASSNQTKMSSTKKSSKKSRKKKCTQTEPEVSRSLLGPISRPDVLTSRRGATSSSFRQI